MCGNRAQSRLDPLFANPTDITDLLFYFKNVDRYVDPGATYKRAGAAPDFIAGSTGIFCNYQINGNSVKVTDVSNQYIQPLSVTLNNQGVTATVRFKGETISPEVSQETFWQGYRGATNRAFYNGVADDRKAEFLKSVVQSDIEKSEVIKQDVEGQDINLSSDPAAYFKVKSVYTASSLMEQAGGDYLFSVGKLIGRQNNLYQETTRQLDIEFPTISNYNHVITIEIPSQYIISGLEALKISNSLKNGAEEVMGFHSDYALEGNKIIIKVNEVYKVLNLPKERYEEFRKVVNSAADFNKVVLVLTPK